MRLTSEQVHTIIQTTRSIAGEGASVWLYGSRLDDTRRGGDIDLLIESAPAMGLLERASIKNKLEHSLQLPVDVLATGLNVPDRTFVRIARQFAVKLNGKIDVAADAVGVPGKANVAILSVAEVFVQPLFAVTV